MIKVNAKLTGNKIKIMMIRRNMTTPDVSKALGYANRSSVNRWLAGKSIPSYENFYNLALVLNCKISELVGVEEESGD